MSEFKEINFKEIEELVKQIWEKVKIYKTKIELRDKENKKYILDMFPYPSGSWLHVGHWRGYVLSDVMAKIQKMEWKEVLHPMWFDSFWLPAENYAIKTWIHPKITTFKAIEHFREQLNETWNWYDWDLEVITCTPDYYKWNQWIFLQFFKNWLAYKKEAPVNWCPSCQTVLANEQVVDWKCERCKTPVTKKFLSQWFFKITAFAEKLYNDLDKLSWWPQRVKVMQKNWIWKSEGTEFNMQLLEEDSNTKVVDFKVFTTRLDTVFWMTYVVFSPEKILELIKAWKLQSIKNLDAVKSYCEQAINKSEKDRTSDRQKTGIKLEWVYSVNPFNWRHVEVWVSDYVIWSYWTGVVMAVPAHDTRDWQFAKKFGLEIIRVIYPEEKIVFETDINNIKDLKNAKKEADDNELFYKIIWNKFLWWIDIRDENYLNYWLKKFVKWQVKKDIHKYINWKYVSIDNVITDTSQFDFQDNTAYTKKWIVILNNY